MSTEAEGHENLDNADELIDKVDEEGNPIIVEEGENEQEEKISYIEILDAPRDLPEAVALTFEHLKQIGYELGLIKLCWPEVIQHIFEDRSNFPIKYLKNNEKEKAILLYAENFRKQFCDKYPNRNPLVLACENECGIQKMVCTTIRPTTLPYPELETWQNCSKFVADHLKFEPFDEFPTLLPHRLYSPHTVFLRQSGQSFEIATALCSLLIGVGYDAYVVSGYAIKDITLRIMSRVDCPFLEPTEEEELEEENVVDEKYKLKPPKDLRSKFLQMMEQREIDKVKAEEQKQAEEQRLRTLEEEKRPPDELEGLRVHAWILLRAGERKVETSIFIEPSTGFFYPLDTDLYCGIESVWNHLNYWVNMQDCSKGIGNFDYDLSNTENWEHFLIGEPISWRLQKPKDLEEEEVRDMYDEKHLDMPLSWGMRINIPHDVLKKRFPDGTRTTFYKRTCVEEFAPYVSYDGMEKRITRFDDFQCTKFRVVEEYFNNRRDKLYKSIHDVETNLVTDYFADGREDSVIKHVYHKNNDLENAERTIFFNSEARYDALSKIEVEPDKITEHYEKRDDRLYYRQVTYTAGPEGTSDTTQGVRRPILKIVQKYNRDESKPAGEDIAVREFAIVDRAIHLKFHYGKGNVTASTRTFLKPPISEMGEDMIFRPELTYGYQAEIGAKPIRSLTLFLLFEEQLKEEDKVLNSIRDIEIQISEFLLTRAHELAFTKLDISLFNKEQNVDFRSGMLEKEQQQRVCKEKEVEEETDYLAPYLAKLGNPNHLTYQQALNAKKSCYDDFKQLLVDRANNIQRTFEKTSDLLREKKNYYTANHDSLTPEEEALYFEEVNDMILYLKTLEIRLQRHKDLSPLRFDALNEYLNSHPMLAVLRRD